MRFIPVLVFLISINCFSSDDHLAEVSNYRCWLVTSVVASALQVIPQAFEIGYAGALSSELKTTHFNTTGDHIVLFATTSAFSNSVGLLTAMNLVYRSATLDMTRGLTTTDIKRRRFIELAYAVKALSSMGMQATSSYFAFSIYQQASSPALVPTMITSAVALALSMLPTMGTLALVINSCMQRRAGYTELSSH